MARKVQVQLIDDLSGEEAQETVRFGVDGAEYEIDLSAGHATELRGLFEQYVAHGRRLRGTSGTSGAKTAPIGREETRKIREWAHANGYNPSARGQISQDIKRAYHSRA
ncbi:Lsr2 family protein [Arthrobacter sp. UYEF20]|uniref:histone-like nucleoid-structuring protein Lsr2 n=1 Tax=Arthrobacter sp. UYEF20 TaxID=1756363 RepID=UPI0033917B47